MMLEFGDGKRGEDDQGENGWMRYMKSNWNEAGGTKSCEDRKETLEKAGQDGR